MTTRPLALLTLAVGCPSPSTPTVEIPDACLDLVDPIEVGGAIDTDTEWLCANVGYVATTDLSVGGGATLTIGPGVTVWMPNQGSLLVGGDSAGGALVANGTEDAPIVFTSLEAVPSPGDWEGVIIDGNATRAELSWVHLEYGGDFAPDGSVGANGALVVIGSADVTDSTFVNSVAHGIDFVDGGRAGRFGSNTFADNSSEDIRIFAEHLGSIASTNTFDDNGLVRVEGDVVETSATWAALGAPYRVVADIAVEGAGTSADVVIEAGTEMRFDPQATLVVGYNGPASLVAVGTEEAPILFTSAQAVPEPGDWEGIVVDGNATEATFRHIQIAYAGDFSPDASVGGSAALRAIESDITVRSCTFTNNILTAVWFDGGAQALDFGDNVFTDNDRPISALATTLASLAGPNTFDGGDRIEVRGGTVVDTGTWLDIGAPYQLTDNVRVEGAAGPVLTLAPGVELQMDPQVSVVVGSSDAGGLVADGTTGRITLTAAEPVPAAGDWEAVVFDGNTLPGSLLRDVDVSYCGDFTPDASTGIRGCVGVIDSAPTIEGCTIDQSVDHGIDLVGTASPTLINNSFSNIAGNDVD